MPLITTFLKRQKSLADMSDEKIKMRLACPRPKMDFDIITLGHGSGGLLTNRLLESGVFNLLENDMLNQKHDGSVFQLDGPTAFTADSFVVSPIQFPGGDIGELAVNGTVNDLAMCGAIPKYLSLSFILEEGLSLDVFWEILLSVKLACEKAGVAVVTGDTKVVEKGKGDGIFINTSGIGQLHPAAKISVDNVQIGDQIIISGPVATHGMAIMSVREGLEFESTIESDTFNLNGLVQSLLDEFGADLHLLRDPTRGGVASVLSEIATQGNFGIEIEQERVPVLQQVASACEILGLDPLYVANEGIFVGFVTGSRAEQMVKCLQELAPNSQPAIIGQVVAAHSATVILTSGLGGKRVLPMLAGEQLPRIC